MGKTRAEIQKAYRERKKLKDGEAYLEKERQRRRQNYVPSSQLNRNELLKRNLKNLDNLKRHRSQKKALLAAAANENEPEQETSGYESQGAASHQQLVVRLPLPNARRLGPRRRTNKALAKAYRTIADLKDRQHELSKKYYSLKRKVKRHDVKMAAGSTSTPKRKTEAMMKQAKFNTIEQRKIRKNLLLSNALISEITHSKDEMKTSKRPLLHRIVSGKIIKKYRCLNQLSSQTGLCRHKLSNVRNKCIVLTKGKRTRTLQIYQSSVLAFLERDDNSRVQPGKADSKKLDGQKIQTRVLTDYISNLHAKYMAENPDIKLSLETFRRMRPKYILLTSFITRHSCLCTKHQNMALQLKTLRKEGILVSPNPETFLKDHVDLNIIVAKMPEHVIRSQWKRVTVEEKGKTKSVTRIVDSQVTRDIFIDDLKKQVEDFSCHVGRVQTQYAEIRRLKETLPQHQMICHMDFAENYSCKTVDEIQSAYWNQVGVTLHPIVVYYRNDAGQLTHQSFVAVSDEVSHASSTVIAILHKLMPDIKALDENVEIIHYWTDSPTSQYRNKVVFSTVANHQTVFGMKARWNYFEAGHGKGPCDGLGGTTKRMADEAVRSGKCVIQDPKGFFTWARSSNMKSVKFFFVSSEECQDILNRVKQLKLKSVKGTMKIHAVVGHGISSISVRDVSCYCDVCITGGLCDTWRKESLASTDQSEEIQSLETAPTVQDLQPKESQVTHSSATEVQDSQTSPSEEAQTAGQEEPRDAADHEYSPGSYVAAIYDGRWYIGRVLEVDNTDHTVNITFMEKRNNSFSGPDAMILFGVRRKRSYVQYNLLKQVENLGAC